MTINCKASSSDEDARRAKAAAQVAAALSAARDIAAEASAVAGAAAPVETSFAGSIEVPGEASGNGILGKGAKGAASARSNLQSPNLQSPNLHSPSLHSPDFRSPGLHLKTRSAVKAHRSARGNNRGVTGGAERALAMTVNHALSERYHALSLSHPAARRDQAAADHLRLIEDIATMCLQPGGAAEVLEVVPGGLQLNAQIDFVAAVAASIGRRWERDHVSFFDLTSAFGRLQSVFRGWNQGALLKMRRPSQSRCMIITPHGDGHIFAANLLQQGFISNGWQADLALPANSGHVPALYGAKRYDLVCISWANINARASVVALLRAVGKIPHHNRPAIIMGGGAAEQNEVWLKSLGVTAICATINAALDIGQKLGRAADAAC